MDGQPNTVPSEFSLAKNLWKKVLLAQAAIKPIAKDQDNPYYKSKYFDINSVIGVLRPILNDVGLVVIQPVTMLERAQAIETLIIDPESGEWFSRTMALQESPDVQKFGGTLTYSRRYALVSLFLMQGEEDDDGNSVVQVAKPEKSKASPVNKVKNITENQKKEIQTLGFALSMTVTDLDKLSNEQFHYIIPELTEKEAASLISILRNKVEAQNLMK